MKVMSRFILIVLGVVPLLAIGQKEMPQYNPNSINPIPRYEHLYKRRVWRDVDLREKQNKGLFARNGEITKLIVDAVRSGEIPNVYFSDSLTTIVTKDEFAQMMVYQQGVTYPAWDPANTYYLYDVVSFNGVNFECQIDNNVGINPPQAANGEWLVSQQGKSLEYLAKDIYRLTVVEDVIFDKRRSRLYYDIQAFGMSAFDDNTGTYKPLGWYKYKDLEKVFRNNPEKAVWFNRQNTAENKNYADAFLLRLFKGVITKIENPDDFTIEEVYRASNRPYYESVWAREWAEIELMEKEHNLWEF
jgi:gliding motility associated protien GldN